MGDRNARTPNLRVNHLDGVVCPVCHAGLRLDAGAVLCTGCRRLYPIFDGLPVLIASRAQIVGEFAE